VIRHEGNSSAVVTTEREPTSSQNRSDQGTIDDGRKMAFE
jgi:hypothetical protein